MAAAQFPPVLIRAIVAAMRRAPVDLKKPEAYVSLARPLIHRLRALSACWAAEIDDDARRRNMAILTPIMDLHLVRYFMRIMPSERRRRILVRADLLWRQPDAAQSLLKDVVHLRICDDSESIAISVNAMEALPLSLRSFKICQNGDKEISYFGASIAKLQNLRNLSIQECYLENNDSFIELLAQCKRLRFLNLRRTVRRELSVISALLRSVPSLRKIDLHCHGSPNNDMLLAALRAEIGDLAEKVIF